MNTSLASTDRAKVNEYLDAVRDVERRIQLAEEQSSRVLPSMDRPAGGFPASYEQYAKLMIDLQVLAFQTDMTRIITFMLAHEKSDRSYREIGIPDAHHPLSHHRGDPASIEKLGKLNTYHVKMLAYYMERLKATRDGDGSLLDHSMCWSTVAASRMETFIQTRTSRSCWPEGVPGRSGRAGGTSATPRERL